MFLPENITLGPGDRGELVFRLQQILHARGNYLGESEFSGHYDGYTTTAVIRFQGAHGLRTDGICGPETIRVLNGGRPNQDDKNALDPGMTAAGIYGTYVAAEMIGDASTSDITPTEIGSPAQGAEVPPNLQQAQNIPPELKTAPLTRDRMQQASQALPADMAVTRGAATGAALLPPETLRDGQALRDNIPAGSSRVQPNAAALQQLQNQPPNPKELTPEMLLRQQQQGVADGALQTRGPSLESDVKPRAQAFDSRQMADNMARQAGMGVTKDKDTLHVQQEAGRDALKGKEGLRDRAEGKERDAVSDAVKAKQDAQAGTGKQEQDVNKAKSQNEVRQEVLQKQAVKDIDLEKARESKEGKREEKQQAEKQAREPEKEAKIVKEFEGKDFVKLNQKQEDKQERREERQERKEEKREAREAERQERREEKQERRAERESGQDLREAAQGAKNSGVEYGGNVRAVPEAPSTVPMNNAAREAAANQRSSR